MKKIIALFTAMAFAMTLGVAFAQEKAEAPAAPEKKEEKAPAKKKKAAKKEKKKKRKGLRFHALGLPGLVFVSGAGAAAIAAREAAGGDRGE